jgi:hypothetical protein
MFAHFSRNNSHRVNLSASGCGAVKGINRDPGGPVVALFFLMGCVINSDAASGQLLDINNAEDLHVNSVVAA